MKSATCTRGPNGASVNSLVDSETLVASGADSADVTESPAEPFSLISRKRTLIVPLGTTLAIAIPVEVTPLAVTSTGRVNELLASIPNTPAVVCSAPPGVRKSKVATPFTVESGETSSPQATCVVEPVFGIVNRVDPPDGMLITADNDG